MHTTVFSALGFLKDWFPPNFVRQHSPQTFLGDLEACILQANTIYILIEFQHLATIAVICKPFFSPSFHYCLEYFLL